MSDKQFLTTPRPVTILQPNEDDHTFKLNDEFLEKVLLDPKFADKKVSIISVAGAYRNGKSFLLNFFLRYLKYQSEHGGNSNDDDWIRSESHLKGFSWRGGSDAYTKGILVWSEPFIVLDRNGEEIVVLLMDTQGSESTLKEGATILAWSTMISSVQIYNVSQNIQEYHLQQLLFLTNLENNTTIRPFQSLLFLVRDWGFEEEYGFEGGQLVLNKRLEVTEKQRPELQQVGQNIRASFDNIQCFLMPHPGEKVSKTNSEFFGELEYINENFIDNLLILVPRLLDSKNIVPKSINGSPVTCRELTTYFKMNEKTKMHTQLIHPNDDESDPNNQLLNEIKKEIKEL